MLQWLILLVTSTLFGQLGGPPAAGTDATSGGGAKPPQPDASGAGAKPDADKAADDKKDTDKDKLGDGGKAALKAEREARQAAEAAAREAKEALQQLQDATADDHQKAINVAVREATAATNGKWASHVRTAEVRGALRAAGIVSDDFLDLALKADQFTNLKVDSDTGAVSGVSDAVEAFRDKYPQAFGGKQDDDKEQDNKSGQQRPPQPPPPGQPAGGQWDGGQGGPAGNRPADNLQSAIERHYQK